MIRIKKIEVTPTFWQSSTTALELFKKATALRRASVDMRALQKRLIAIDGNATDAARYATNSAEEIRHRLSSLRNRFKRTSAESYLHTFALMDRRYKLSFSLSGMRSLTMPDLREVKTNLAHRLRELRKEQKRIASRNKYFAVADTSLKVCHGIFLEPGSILKLLTLKRGKDITKPKKPRANAKENHIGIEIECFFPDRYSKTDLTVKLIEAGLAAKVECKSDGSISPFSGHWAIEVTMLETEAQLEGTLRSLTGVLNALDARVNKSCGLHVHIDVRHRDAMLTAERLIKSQPLLFKVQPVSRRNNSYCRRTPLNAASRIGYSSDRYRAVNVCSINRHQTVEVRLHSATTDFQKIYNWCQLLLRVVVTDFGEAKPRSLNGFAKLLGLSDDLKGYFKSRIDKFANPADADESVDPHLPEVVEDEIEHSRCEDCACRVRPEVLYHLDGIDLCESCYIDRTADEDAA